MTGAAGFLPIHPRHYLGAWRIRAREEAAQKERDAALEAAVAAAADAKAAAKEQAQQKEPDS